MSKGKDFRAPRKRGFDDDGPMPYEPRPRGSRGFGGGPEAALRRRADGADAPGRRAASPRGPTVDAVVKWFKADKGYGFVELASGQGDAFLHANALHASGHESVPHGRQAQGDRRRRRQRRAGDPRGRSRHQHGAVEQRPQRSVGDGRRHGRRRRPRPRRAAPDPSTAVSVSGRVKWFDDTKGFGFVASDDGGKDVFVHISVLGPCGISHLAEGQAVNMRVVDTPKGREAISLSI